MENQTNGNDPSEPSDNVNSTKTVYKNLIVVSVAFMFLFTAFQSLSFLQSTINQDNALGPTGLATIYAALILSSMFLPSFLVANLGCKWTIAVSMICYVIYMAANMKPSPYWIYPASIIIGIGAAPLWSAKCTFLTELAVRYSKKTGVSQDATINRFFGIFFMLFQTWGIWGNIISSTVLKSQKRNISAHELELCGAQFCPQFSRNNTNLQRPSDTKIYTLVGCYFACAVLGFGIIVIFLDKIFLTKDNDNEGKTNTRRLSPRLFIATFEQLWKSKSQKLLVPLTIFSGVEQAFIAGDYTQAYVACSSGIWNVGFVMICFAAVDSLCSFTFGRLVKYLGHIFFFLSASVVNFGVLIALMFWTPTSASFYALFFVASLWGMSDAVWQTQINALYGHLFTTNTEAAFANYRLWESLGFAVTFAYSSYLCTNMKIYICIAILVIGTICYIIVEILQKSKRTYNVNTDIK